MADDRQVGAEVVRVALDREPSALGFVAELAAELVDVGTAFAASAIVIIIATDLVQSSWIVRSRDRCSPSSGPPFKW